MSVLALRVRTAVRITLVALIVAFTWNALSQLEAGTPAGITLTVIAAAILWLLLALLIIGRRR